MFKQFNRAERRQKIHHRIRHRLMGTPQRPRLCVFRSLKHMYAQIVDDLSGHTLVSASTLTGGDKKLEKSGNIEAAKRVGRELAEKAKVKGIESVVFDRGGYRYHGRVQALAESAREAGLKF